MTGKDITSGSDLGFSQKEDLLRIRNDFFDEILEEWSRPPETIDDIMGQSEFFLMPDFASHRKNDPETVMVKDVKRGLLAVSVTPPQSTYPLGGLRLVYSIMQAGDWIRYGFLLQGDPRLVIMYQQHHDNLLSVERIWDRPCDYQFRDRGGLLVEWRFREPQFYKEYMYRERFKIITRHLHFRLGRSVLSVFDDPSDSVALEDYLNKDQLNVSSPMTSSLVGFDKNHGNIDDFGSEADESEQ